MERSLFPERLSEYNCRPPYRSTHTLAEVPGLCPEPQPQPGFCSFLCFAVQVLRTALLLFVILLLTLLLLLPGRHRILRRLAALPRRRNPPTRLPPQRLCQVLVRFRGTGPAWRPIRAHMSALNSVMPELAFSCGHRRMLLHGRAGFLQGDTWMMSSCRRLR